MKQLLMLSGLPASGKSTLARKMVEENRNLGRINRDELRKMIFNGRWSHYNEKIIVESEKAIAKVLLDHSREVLVDDTNLSTRHLELWKGFCNTYSGDDNTKDIKFENEFLDTDLKTCLQRDQLREDSVGHNVIIKMAARNGLLKWPDKPIVLVDIDGTLALDNGRQEFLRQDPKDWKAYYSLLHTDKPATHIFKWVSELAKDHTIVIVSGRGAEWEEQTRKWFETVWLSNPLFPDLDVPRFDIFTFFFRDKGDRRPDDIVKLEFLKLLPMRPVLILDDRPSVVRAWQNIGLKVIPVAGACEEF